MGPSGRLASSSEEQVSTGQRTTQGTTYLLVNYDFYQGGQTGDDPQNQQPVIR